MAFLRQIKLLLTFGSLAWAAAVVRMTDGAGGRGGGDDDDDDTPLPLVIWHGLGDNFAAEGLREIGTLAESVHPGTLVYYVHLDDTADGDRSATFLGNVTEQVDQVCAALAADPILSTAPAIDALGFSQGGQFLRAYAQRCNRPPVRSLVTFGSQHNGITAFAACGTFDLPCRGAMSLLRGNVWSAAVQGHLVPAQYFRDPSTPAAYAQYQAHSAFLADINNERVAAEDAAATATATATRIQNDGYKANLARLTNFAMYLFDEDTTAIPKESAWFAEVNGTEVVPLRARALYREDWLGLKQIDERGGLYFRTVPGEHMRLRDTDLVAAFTDFFGPYGRTFNAPADRPGGAELEL